MTSSSTNALQTLAHKTSYHDSQPCIHDSTYIIQLQSRWQVQKCRNHMEVVHPYSNELLITQRHCANFQSITLSLLNLITSYNTRQLCHQAFLCTNIIYYVTGHFYYLCCWTFLHAWLHIFAGTYVAGHIVDTMITRYLCQWTFLGGSYISTTVYGQTTLALAELAELVLFVTITTARLVAVGLKAN